MTIDCPGVPSFTEPRATDECSSASIVLVSDITEGDACSYTQTKTWKAVDICGNESGTVSQAITVHDITAPSISGEGADAFLEDCHADVVFTAPIASDLCDPSPSVNVVSTSTVQNADGSITHTRVWSASDRCNNVSASVDQSITVAACRAFCSFTQGFYGNKNGAKLIPILLAQGDLVIGKPGRSFTIKLADAACLNKNMPAGGPVKMLPLGNAGYSASCATTIPLKNGKFDNVLLGQTIALGLNIRNDAGLGGLILNGTIMTTTGGTKAIPQSVLDALQSIYGSRSVANLFDLANRALGGLSTGGASLSDINQAVSAINEGFDECKNLIGFSGGNSRTDEAIVSDASNDVTLNAVPNPFAFSTSLEFITNADSKVKVEVYNVTGVRVATLFNEDVKANEAKSVMFNGQYLPNGMYIYVLTANEKAYYYKLLLVR
jgi:hypothetical protein